MEKYNYLNWTDFGIEYLVDNCDKVRKVRFPSWFSYTINVNGGRYGSMSDTFRIYSLACEKALKHVTRPSDALQEAYKSFKELIPDVSIE